MSTDIQQKNNDSLFSRVVTILENARSNVVRSVNSNMVLAYWLIGREIVQELQEGKERAEYGKRVVEMLSDQLMAQYGSGFSVTTLQYFRKFYLAYPNRCSSIPRPVGVEFNEDRYDIKKSRHLGVESIQEHLSLESEEKWASEKGHPSGGELSQGFSPQLSWSHYRALMRVKDKKARLFYEQEAIDCGWSKAQLERQNICSTCQAKKS